MLTSCGVAAYIHLPPHPTQWAQCRVEGSTEKYQTRRGGGNRFVRTNESSASLRSALGYLGLTLHTSIGELLVKSAGIVNSEGAAERARAIAASGVGTVGGKCTGRAGGGAMAATRAGVVPEGVGGAGGVDDAQVRDAHAVVQEAPTVAAAPRVDNTARMAATRLLT